ncbi:MAG: DJ-1/PfpI family protein [Chloroflexota bacterium]
MPGKKSQTHPYNFVLCGGYFDEQMAISLITALRSVGHKVKSVSLRGEKVAGMHGVTIVPDMTLNQAMAFADQAACVILPCHTPHVTPWSHDPRLHQFLRKARENEALFVMGRVKAEELDLLTIPAAQMISHHNVNAITDHLD